MTTRDHLLALLSEGRAPGRRGISRATIDRALRAAKLSTRDVDAELAALVREQELDPRKLGLVATSEGTWWATVLGHRAGKRVPLAPETRAALRAAVRSAEAS